MVNSTIQDFKDAENNFTKLCIKLVVTKEMWWNCGNNI